MRDTVLEQYLAKMGFLRADYVPLLKRTFRIEKRLLNIKDGFFTMRKVLFVKVAVFLFMYL